MMISAISTLDVLVCVLVLLASLEYLRCSSITDSPLICSAFYFVSIGAFGHLIELFNGSQATPWITMINLGVATFMVTKWHDLIALSAAEHWPEVERRGRH